eukprot:snap_masked-scaffold_8-processed-gene-6.37-mRNA-1 protein AED:1.00 eAED:1.00 QI:0/-1/0/0/-1/1/1/0/311
MKASDSRDEVEQAFEALYAAYSGKPIKDVPLRWCLSPINLSIKKFYTTRRCSIDPNLYTQALEKENDDVICVKFQGFNVKNVKLDWFKVEKEMFGVVSRRMTTLVRNSTKKGLSQEETPTEREARKHGFTGCSYSLIKPPKDYNFESITKNEIKYFLVPNVPSYVAIEGKRINRKRQAEIINSKQTSLCKKVKQQNTSGLSSELLSAVLQQEPEVTPIAPKLEPAVNFENSQNVFESCVGNVDVLSVVLKQMEQQALSNLLRNSLPQPLMNLPLDESTELLQQMLPPSSLCQTLQNRWQTMLLQNLLASQM